MKFNYMYGLYAAAVIFVLFLVYMAYKKYTEVVEHQARLETNLRKVIDIINEMCSEQEEQDTRPTPEPTTQATPQQEDFDDDEDEEETENGPVLIQVGKNARCQFVLEAGKRRGFLCDKKSPTRNGFCRNHTTHVMVEPEIVAVDDE